MTQPHPMTQSTWPQPQLLAYSAGSTMVTAAGAGLAAGCTAVIATTAGIRCPCSATADSLHQRPVVLCVAAAVHGVVLIHLLQVCRLRFRVWAAQKDIVPQDTFLVSDQGADIHAVLAVTSSAEEDGVQLTVAVMSMLMCDRGAFNCCQSSASIRQTLVFPGPSQDPRADADMQMQHVAEAMCFAHGFGDHSSQQPPSQQKVPKNGMVNLDFCRWWHTCRASRGKPLSDVTHACLTISSRHPRVSDMHA